MSCISSSLKVLSKSRISSQISCLHTQHKLNQAIGLERKMRKTREKHFYEEMNSWRNQDDFLHDITSNHILLQDDNLLVINKPNKIAMAGAEYEHLTVSALRDSNCPTFSIKSIENDLRKHVNADYFKNISSQPRLYSGPVIFAKSEKYFNKLQKYFKHCRINRVLCHKYLVLCLGVPSNIDEPVDFHMERIQRDGYTVVTLMKFNELDYCRCPCDYSVYLTFGACYFKFTAKNYKPSNERRKKRESTVITINHRILSKAVLGGGQAKVSLLEVTVNLTKWNAMETYLVDNCFCPILGDHVYSSRLNTLQGKTVRLSPKQCLPQTQKLPYEVYKALEFPLEKLVFHTPLHIHCHELCIPDFSATKASNKQIVIKNPLPSFFERSLNLLGLNLEC